MFSISRDSIVWIFLCYDADSQTVLVWTGNFSYKFKWGIFKVTCWIGVEHVKCVIFICIFITKSSVHFSVSQTITYYSQFYILNIKKHRESG